MRNTIEDLEALTKNINTISNDIINECFLQDGKVSKVGLKRAKVMSQNLIKKLRDLQKLASYIDRLKSTD